MGRGRPAKPIEFKRRDGNTGKVSKAAYNAQLEAVIESSPGEPEFPPEMAECEGDEPEVLARKQDFARRWHRICESLRRDQILYLGHGAMIASLAQAEMRRDRAFFSDDDRAFDLAQKQIMQITTLIGLNASGAAKIPRPVSAKMDSLEAALCG